MNMEFQDNELFADFIIEAKEHLETIEPTLLELEKAPENLALLNDIFRPMHSLKGASGFLGLNNINRLAHMAESVLDELRKGTIAITSGIMDTILSVTDALNTMIDVLSNTNTDGDNSYPELLSALEAILNGESPSLPDSEPASESTAVQESEVDEVDETVIDESVQDDTDVIESSSEGETVVQALTSKEWIAGQLSLDTEKLNVLGEGHLIEFIDEVAENIDSITDGLLMLEKNPDFSHDLINDLFRYFHNVKGGSGIIDYKELNNLTHEAETLLNKVRHGDIEIKPELVDLLLFVSDVMNALVKRIDRESATVVPFDCRELIIQLQKCITGEEITLLSKVVAVASGGSLLDDANAQKEVVRASLASLDADASQDDKISALSEGLSKIEALAAEHKYAAVVEYAQRTNGLVTQARQSDMDFSLMVDLLKQESEIIFEMFDKAYEENPPAAPVVAPKPAPAKVSPPKAEAVKVAEKKEAPKEAAPSAPAPSTTPASTSSSAPASTSATAAKAPAPAQAAANPDKASTTIRVDHEKLDALMNLIGELIINRNRYSMIAKQLEEKNEEINIAAIGQNLAETTYALARISDELQDTIMKVRMVPVSSVFARFPRLVRDLSRKSKKDVELVLEGEETELDKSVAEVISDPLVHLIRNSVDHGVESPEDRIAVGKSEKGKVILRAYHKGNSVLIEIEDDGKGIDADKMRAVAVKKEIITEEEARNLSDREAVELIFAPGFSSAAEITDISGRGVGMDVVRTNIKNLKGSVITTTELGKGTKFTLSLPLTLAIIDALMINISEQTFAIPLDAVSETTKIEKERISNIKGKKVVTLRGEVLGLVELSTLLNLEPLYDELPEMLSVVILQDGDKRLGLIVDRLLERQEIVIKPLGAYLHDLKGISGATIMGDGSVILILEPHEIYSMSISKDLVKDNM